MILPYRLPKIRHCTYLGSPRARIGNDLVNIDHNVDHQHQACRRIVQRTCRNYHCKHPSSDMRTPHNHPRSWCSSNSPNIGRISNQRRSRGTYTDHSDHMVRVCHRRHLTMMSTFHFRDSRRLDRKKDSNEQIMGNFRKYYKNTARQVCLKLLNVYCHL